MTLQPFTITSRCVADDATLYAHIESALARNLPTVQQYEPHNGVAVLVGSGPSVQGYLEEIRNRRLAGDCVIALKDTHDWLIQHEIIPHFAVAIDPQAERATVFQSPHSDVTYLIASQVHPSMLDHLSLFHVELWHAYIKDGQTVPPPGTPMIAGGTTTGLRAITLLYSMGFRRFELYGFDSCLSDGVLRMNGTRPRSGDDTVHEIVVDSQTFHSTPAMTAQASEFQNLYLSMPDMQLQAHGHGLIQAIVRARAARPIRTVSFLHHFGPNSASFRYRTQIPAQEIGATINDLTADVLVIGKPDAVTITEVKQALGRGQSVIVDICDDHFHLPHYRAMVRLADAVTCCSSVLQRTIAELGRESTVIPDPYEYPEVEPHCHGAYLLWFGHASNLSSAYLERFSAYPLRVVSNAAGTIPWSLETMRDEFARADIVILPHSAPYKSANRAIEAIRQGCFVVAEPHPALTEIPGIWIGDIQEGIAWASQHPHDANKRIRASQMYVSRTFAPKIVAYAWSRVIQACPSTWGQVIAPGPIGSMLTSTPEPTYATI